ncbi:MAG: hypothetical protein AB7N91_19965 [Candidatus Tectimicrobiota bacterium]
MSTAASTLQLESYGLHEVESLFFRQLAPDAHPGAQLAVYHAGQLVLELRGGFADAQRCRRVERHTRQAYRF